jgi:hypothetical protein
MSERKKRLFITIKQKILFNENSYENMYKSDFLPGF